MTQAPSTSARLAAWLVMLGLVLTVAVPRDEDCGGEAGLSSLRFESGHFGDTGFAAIEAAVPRPQISMALLKIRDLMPVCASADVTSVVASGLVWSPLERPVRVWFLRAGFVGTVELRL